MAGSRSGLDDFQFPKGKTLILKEELRQPLKELLEPLTPEDRLKSVLKDSGKIISIGDMVTLTLATYGIIPNICIVDFKTKRFGLSKDDRSSVRDVGKNIVKVRNPPGTITSALWYAIETAILSSGSVRIEVNGEEDLATLPCLSIAPTGTAIIYGVPDMGIEIVHVNTKAKLFANEILRKMMVI